MTRRLEKDLLAVGETAVRVPPKLMAETRESVRQSGKSDPIDALAIGRAALRHDDLPEARLDGPERVIRIISDRRDGLVSERTRLVNRLRWRLHELDPTNVPVRGGFNRKPTMIAMTKLFAEWSQSVDPVEACLGTVGTDELQRVSQLNTEIGDLEQQLGELTADQTPGLLTIVGIGPVNAATIVGHVGNIDRFVSEGQFASLVATAPIPVASGNSTRVRLNPGGDRHLNAVIHRIAITQLSHHPPAKQLVANAVARGKTKKEAIRILKRHITRAIYAKLKHDQNSHYQQAA